MIYTRVNGVQEYDVRTGNDRATCENTKKVRKLSRGELIKNSDKITIPVDLYGPFKEVTLR